METKEEGRKYTRSLSQLKLYTRCGELYRLERFERSNVPRRPAAWTIMGVAVHEAVMRWEKDSRIYDLPSLFSEEYHATTSEQWEKQPDPDYWILPPRTKSVKTSIDNYRERGIKQMEVYEERCRNAPWEISHIEEEFEIQLGDVLVKGAIDRILHWEIDDEYAIEDLKSGNIKGEDDIRQLGFYAMVAREILGVPVKEGRYWFTKLDRGSQFVNLEKYDREFWTEEFRKVDQGINNGIFLASPGDACGICSVKPWCNTMGWLEVGEKLR